ncbi:hypothetical protein GGR56DRAFT_232333 [Xylariaceae sp. FL0804]|nr:hypothetical protein GGR56DRAFT_232333 [Xylariaceae sp. FL0804]
MAGFSFSFSGDDIEAEDRPQHAAPSHDAVPQVPPQASAFPVDGKPLLPPTSHLLGEMLSRLPSKIAYGLLDVDLDGNGSLQLPRRELWDVRVQIMAEEGGEGGGGGGGGAEAEPGLGNHDVKTGVYEGGFKSWESSIDLVRVLAASEPFASADEAALRIVELGCGTALPSLALFAWALSLRTSQQDSPLSIVLADYNPSVLQLVTLPNFILCWALHERADSPMLEEAFSTEGELDLTTEVLGAFQQALFARKIHLSFFSGAWSPGFVQLVTSANETSVGKGRKQSTIILGAETIYSPFALDSFAQTVFSLMEHDRALGNTTAALVGAKKLYFGVGGSLDDFIAQAKARGSHVEQLREETEGIRRGVVRCSLPS